jgi:Ran GTPase-activating protein (RanGAP) involved in mRNA processing and transport
MKNLKNMQSLSLLYCQITDEGLLSLSLGLQNSKSLGRLDLTGNMVSHYGFESLLDVLNNPDSPITSLSLQGNQISEITSSIESFLKQTLLKDLNLAYMRLSSQSQIAKVFFAMKSNKFT